MCDTLGVRALFNFSFHNLENAWNGPSLALILFHPLFGLAFKIFFLLIREKLPVIILGRYGLYICVLNANESLPIHACLQKRKINEKAMQFRDFNINLTQ